MSDWTIRLARRDELATVADLTVEVYASLDGGSLHPDYERHLRDIEARARDCELYVAVDGERVVGSVAYVPGPGPQASIAREGEAEFRTLVVDPTYAARGVGEALVRMCLHLARRAGREAVVLSTMPWMTKAQRLYERIGFRRTPDRDWSPRPGYDCLTYRLEL